MEHGFALNIEVLHSFFFNFLIHFLVLRRDVFVLNT